VTHWSAGRVFRLLVATSLTALALWTASPSAALHAAAPADFRWIAAAIVLVVVDRALMAYRWLILLCPIDADQRPALGAIMRVFFVSTFLGTFLPASVGGDIVRAFKLAQLRVARGPAVASVIMDRLLGVLSIVLVGVAGLILAPAGSLASTRAIAVSLTLASAICLAGALVVFSERVALVAHRTLMWLPMAALRRLASELTQATRAYAKFHPELTYVLVGSIGVQVLRVLQAYCLGRALAIEASPAAYFAFVPLILLVMLLPVSINGIGTSQVAFVWFFGTVGVPSPEALALSVLFLALGVVGNLPGGLLYAFGPRSAPA